MSNKIERCRDCGATLQTCQELTPIQGVYVCESCLDALIRQHEDDEAEEESEQYQADGEAAAQTMNLDHWGRITDFID